MRAQYVQGYVVILQSFCSLFKSTTHMQLQTAYSTSCTQDQWENSDGHQVIFAVQ